MIDSNGFCVVHVCARVSHPGYDRIASFCFGVGDMDSFGRAIYASINKFSRHKHGIGSNNNGKYRLYRNVSSDEYDEPQQKL